MKRHLFTYGLAAIVGLTGHPAMSVMCGLSSNGIPLGMQIAGPHDREDLVLNVAAAFQNATDWSDRHPPLHAA